MLHPTYRKGLRWLWIGFIGTYIFGVLRFLNDTPFLALLTLIFFVVFLIGSGLVMKAKNRSILWLVLCFILPFLNIVVILNLADKSQLTAAERKGEISTIRFLKLFFIGLIGAIILLVLMAVIYDYFHPPV